MPTPSKDMMKAMGLRRTAAKGKSGAGTRKYNQQKTKIGKELTWAEEQQLKELGSRKVMKKLYNDMSKVKFRDPKKISRIYSPNTRVGPRSARGYVGVQMEGGAKGWLNTESLKVWTQSESEDILFSLDRLAREQNLTQSSYLLRRYKNMTADEQAYMSAYLSEMDWDYIWMDIYPKGKDVMDAETGDLHSKQLSLYEQVEKMMEAIETM